MHILLTMLLETRRIQRPNDSGTAPVKRLVPTEMARDPGCDPNRGAAQKLCCARSELERDAPGLSWRALTFVARQKPGKKGDAPG